MTRRGGTIFRAVGLAASQAFTSSFAHARIFRDNIAPAGKPSSSINLNNEGQLRTMFAATRSPISKKPAARPGRRGRRNAGAARHASPVQHLQSKFLETAL
jgi:hypothetical protein